jgi:hypothetical protein
MPVCLLDVVTADVDLLHYAAEEGHVGIHLKPVDVPPSQRMKAL